MAENLISLRILHTNDLHNQLEAIPALAKLMNRLSEEAVHERRFVLRLDAGDFLDDVRLESQGDSGVTMGRILQALKYDAVTFGNHDLYTAGLENLEPLQQALDTPLLAANFRRLNGESVPGLQDSVLLEREGVKIGILGLSSMIKPKIMRYFGGTCLDWKPVIQEQLEQLASQGVQFYILLSHLGLPLDREVAAEFPQLSVIVGGHTHNRLEEPEWVAGVAIIQAWEFGKTLGVLDLEIDVSSGRVCGLDSKLVEVDRFDECLEAKAWMEKQQSCLREEMSKEIFGSQPETKAPEEVAQLLADFMRNQYDADIGLINQGCIRGEWAAGNVTPLVLMEMFIPYLQVAIVKLRGSKLKELLEASLSPEVQVYRRTYDSPETGRVFTSGLQLELDQGKESGCIRSLQIQGRECEPNVLYRIVSTDYIACGHAPFEMVLDHEGVEIHKEYLRDVAISIIMKDVKK